MGRHRTFDVEDAITAAAKLFWRGYDQTSLTDLTEAIQVSPASLYLAFGSKEGLFRRTIERYVTYRDKAFDFAFTDTTAVDGVKAMLEAYIAVLSDTAHAPGCLLVNNALAAASGTPLQLWLQDDRNAFRKKLELKFEADVESGRLPKDFDGPEMARFIMTVASGLAVEAKNGASAATLRRMAELAVGVIESRAGHLHGQTT